MLTPNCTQVSEELLKRYRRDPAKIYFTTCYSGWNVHPQLRFWVRTTKHAMEWTNRSKLSFHYTAQLRFFHVECKQPTIAKQHKIFLAQKSYCACRVLSLATVRSKYYFIFILNRTRSGRELFDRPRTLHLWSVLSPRHHACNVVCWCTTNALCSHWHAWVSVSMRY